MGLVGAVKGCDIFGFINSATVFMSKPCSVVGIPLFTSNFSTCNISSEA